MVANDDDVDAAVQVHLLQSVHQLTDDVVDVPQWVVQLRGEGTHTLQPTPGEEVQHRGRLAHLATQRSQSVSERVGLLRVHGVDVRPAVRSSEVGRVWICFLPVCRGCWEIIQT